MREVTAEKLVVPREADAIVTEEIRKAGLHNQIWQAFAVLPDVQSVGVMGDERTYAHLIAIRCRGQPGRHDRRLDAPAV